MYYLVVERSKNGMIPWHDAVFCETLKSLQQCKQQGMFDNWSSPECFGMGDGSTKITKMPIDFHIEHLWNEDNDILRYVDDMSDIGVNIPNSVSGQDGGW